MKLLNEDELDLKGGRFEHFVPHRLGSEIIFNQVARDDLDYYSDVILAMDKPWSFRYFLDQSNLLHFGISFHRDVDLVEFKLRLPDRSEIWPLTT